MTFNYTCRVCISWLVDLVGVLDDADFAWGLDTMEGLLGWEDAEHVPFQVRVQDVTAEAD